MSIIIENKIDINIENNEIRCGCISIWKKAIFRIATTAAPVRENMRIADALVMGSKWGQRHQILWGQRKKTEPATADSA